MGKQTYDCIIVGCGPAGLGAALYTARDRFKTLVLEKFYPGGQIINTDRIENYPGLENISGPDLVEALLSQVKQFGAEIKTSSEVSSVKKLDDGTLQVTCDEDSYIGRVVILAPGSSYRKLGVPGEEEFRSAGAGVSYCGTCDAPFFKDKKVVAVGGGNVAVEDTLHIARFASEVTLVHRRDRFRATQVLVEELMDKVGEADSNLKLKLETVVTAIQGTGRVESAKLKNVKTGVEEEIACDGVFIFIGMVPNTDFLKGFVELTDKGFIKCDTSYLRTAVPGVFVVGDCRIGAAMQLATAVGDGVLAAVMMKQYFRDTAWWDEQVSDALLPGGR
ncbi:MAG: thioredoxin-disulfide reductase [Planctomycetota bacterium]|nr:MAG: thioredoxin-disulfide reductase [Planctomycetota bacterium]